MEQIEQENVYIIFCDIAKFSESSNTKMSNTLQKFCEIINEIVIECLKGSTHYLHSTGDGCLVVAKYGKSQKTHFKNKDVKNVLKCAIQIFIRLKDANIPIRMAISSGKATRFNGLNRKPQFVGHDIIDCQRIMDFGEDSHLLMSENLFNLLDKDERYSVDMEIESCKVEIKKAEKQYIDKHGKIQKVYMISIFNEEGELLTKKRLPPLKLKRKKGEALTVESMSEFDRILNESDKFYSVTLERPSEWLLDESLLYVLLKQASINGNNKPNNKFRRFLVCDKDLLQTPDCKMLSNLHRFANVKFFEITQEDAERKIDRDPQLATMQDNLKKVFFMESDVHFIENPLSEMWVSFKGGKIYSAGYGVAVPGTAYEVKHADGDLKDYIGYIISVLIDINTPKGEYAA
ncbi:MAG TPA: hypothetical protein VEL70_00405 [Candidatus Acidoferrum sp.]|nr:hypothetical protein [Candidatus Acidoferrum sp.]